MSSQPDANATPRKKRLSKQISISRSASSKSNSTGLEKNLASSIDRKRQMIEPGHNSISVRRQCQLIGLSRASLYYDLAEESVENLVLMRLLDEQYSRTPFYGVLKMTAWLRENGHPVNCKRVRRLLRLMSSEAIYQKPRLSIPSPGHQVYPYLLRGVKVTRVNQVWSADITYIRLLGGFVYLVAIIDWYSRYVLSWEVSTTLESEFCVSALNRSLQVAKPEIFNTDQGSQFTSCAFTGILKEREI